MIRILNTAFTLFDNKSFNLHVIKWGCKFSSLTITHKILSLSYKICLILFQLLTDKNIAK